MKFILIETGSGQKRQEVAIDFLKVPLPQAEESIKSHRVRHSAREGRKLHIQAAYTPCVERKWQTTHEK